MKSIKYILLLILCSNLYSQEDIEKQFFKNLFKNKNAKVIYSENKFYDFNEIKSSIEQANVVHKMQLDNLPEILLDSLSFSNQELEYIYNEVIRSNNKHWAVDLISKGEYIPRKEIDRIFKIKSKGWDYFHKKYGPGLYSFSKPVFIKNGTVCFFYLSYNCGSFCSSGSFDIYIKQDGDWIFFNSLYSWIS